ncbi:hypothetical protein DUNSADRAFT_13496 [Dunaliella salina]|nr:hypothetical protein DUNSADRAFT_13496 [Dunaliella salina]|eukprot:KAF5831168.1 hypothetical protein DUNSADRAFT_13496 [Dunaliella salina]
MFPFVAEHLRGQILGMATALHNALEQAGDAVPAAHAMRQARAAMAGQEYADACTGKAYLSQHQVSELMRKQWGYSLQVKPSTVDHPEAGLGLFVQGRAPVGAVVALLPGVVYSRTQLPRMPNFPKVALDNPYLSSTIEMNVIDSKPWGLGVKVQQGHPMGSFAQAPTFDGQEARKIEPGHASLSSTPSSNVSSGCVTSRRDTGGNSSSDGSGKSIRSRSTAADEMSTCESPSTSLFSSSHTPTASHTDNGPSKPSPSASSHALGNLPVHSMAYPSDYSAPQPPLLGYMSAYAQQPGDGHLEPAPDSGSWALAGLEERHPLAWAHMANHPGPGMQPNVLEVPFEIDLGPPESYGEGGKESQAGYPRQASQSTDSEESQPKNPHSASQSTDGAYPYPASQSTHDGAAAQAERMCWLRAYIPCVPFTEPVPLEELAQKGWRQAAAEVLLEACGWPHTHKARKSKPNDDGEDDDEEEFVGFRLPGLPAVGRGSSRGSSSSASRQKWKRVQGMALVATQALQDGECVCWH